jgi:hypothetical protein
MVPLRYGLVVKMLSSPEPLEALGKQSGPGMDGSGCEVSGIRITSLVAVMVRRACWYLSPMPAASRDLSCSVVLDPYPVPLEALTRTCEGKLCSIELTLPEYTPSNHNR